MKQANPSGWSAVEEYTADGRIHFEQSARLPAAAVDQSEDGAHELAERYWREVEASTFRLVRTRTRCEGLDLRLLGRWTLLSFGRPETLVDRSAVSSSRGSSPLFKRESRGRYMPVMSGGSRDEATCEWTGTAYTLVD